jgi:hypothetical protein
LAGQRNREAVRPRRLRRPRGRDAAGTRPGVPGGQRAARSRRRCRRRRRQPARPAEHARRADADARRCDIRRPARARRRTAPAGCARRRSDDPRRGRAVLRRRACLLPGRGAPRVARQQLRICGRRSRAVVCARARAGGAGGRRRLHRIRARDVDDDDRVPHGRPTSDGRAAGRVHRSDPEARAAQAADRGGRVRAPDGHPRLPRTRLAVRRVPRHRLAPPDGGPGGHVGRDPDGVHAVLHRPAAHDRLEGRARLAAGQHAALRRGALPGAPQAATVARSSACSTQAPGRQCVPDARSRRAH